MSIPSFIPWVIVALGFALALYIIFRGERPYEALYGVNLSYSGGKLWALTAWEGAARVGVAAFFAFATVVTSVSIARLARDWSRKHQPTVS